MFVPLEVVNQMCAYMPNPDLVNMARVCRHWNPTCVRHVSTQLHIRTVQSYRLHLQEYLDSFDGHGQHYDIPTRPAYIKSLIINLDVRRAFTLDYSILYALLDHLSHVRRLELGAILSTNQLDELEMVCTNIHARLPNIKHLILHSSYMHSYYDDDRMCLLKSWTRSSINACLVPTEAVDAGSRGSIRQGGHAEYASC
jgi:hypothetical protein